MRVSFSESMSRKLKQVTLNYKRNRPINYRNEGSILVGKRSEECNHNLQLLVIAPV